MGHARALLLALVAAAACLLAGAAAVRPEAQGATISLAVGAGAVLSPAVAEAQGGCGSLLTYFLSVTKPQLQLSSAGAGGAARPGRTGLTVTLSEPAVSPWMPVMSPRPDGMTHDVVHTWAALKNYALMFARVNAVNKQAAPGATRLFPRPGVAVQGASDVSPFGKLDVGRIIDSAEAHGQRNTWTEPSPGSVLLLPHGSSTAAVADVMNIAHHEQSGAITLHLELVHSPHTVSEFEAHGKQSLDVHEAHYHFSTPPGVAIDAARLLASLQDAKFEVAGLHVFVKGCGGPSVSFTAPPSNKTVAVGEIFDVTVEVDCPNGTLGDVGMMPVTPMGANYVTLNVTGPAQQFFTLSSDNERQATTINVPLPDGSTGTVQLISIGPGAIVVTIQNFNGNDVNGVGDSTSITVTGGSSEVAKLVLTPHKTHRHVHQHAAITAVAFDSADQPVAGAVVTFTVYDDAHGSYGEHSHRPHAWQRSVTTDAQGRARVDIPSHHPDAVTVVAAVRNPSGTTVVSNTAHIMWTDDYEREEEHYYRGHRDSADEYAE